LEREGIWAADCSYVLHLSADRRFLRRQCHFSNRSISQFTRRLTGAATVCTDFLYNFRPAKTPDAESERC
jgi:hypothetical protein